MFRALKVRFTSHSNFELPVAQDDVEDGASKFETCFLSAVKLTAVGNELRKPVSKALVFLSSRYARRVRTYVRTARVSETAPRLGLLTGCAKRGRTPVFFAIYDLP